jgi:hypothetical protein
VNYYERFSIANIVPCYKYCADSVARAMTTRATRAKEKKNKNMNPPTTEVFFVRGGHRVAAQGLGSTRALPSISQIKNLADLQLESARKKDEGEGYRICSFDCAENQHHLCKKFFNG